MSSTTCAEDGGSGASQRSALFQMQQQKSSKKGEARGELWGRRSLKSHEHKGASDVLAHIGRKASGKGKAGHEEDEDAEEEEEGAERRGNEVEATTDPLSSSRSTGRGSGEGGACGLITGEATPAMLYWEHKGLSLLPRWLACVHPTVKLIVTLRDPVQVSVFAWT